MTEKIRRPEAFTIPKEAAKPKAPHIEFTPLVEEHTLVEAPMAQANAAKRRWGWGSLLIGSLVAILGLWLSFTASQMIESFFTWSLTLGWVSVALFSLAGLALLMIVLREIWGIMRLRRIEHIQIASARAINQNDEAAAKHVAAELKSLYRSHSSMAWPLKSWAEHEGDIIDPPAAMRLAERILLEPLDEAAHRIIARRSRKVTLLTTIAPTAALDVLLVGTQNLFMIREIAALYGSRPSFFATLRLARLVATHLAVTAGLALSDNFIHLFVGKGLLGKLSARFGEGAVNGILTSRIGLAATDVCRPIASTASKRATLASLIKELAGFEGAQPEPQVEAIPPSN
ncbi:YcjF family protein [Aestuariivirga litoralis]|uniref:YcjF family protein n=1 Tax=Aestuariivirga litoralis TaxID=2650924 RepID=UPI0018C5BD97|nr:TIGR01620 family protein [Aestuariivirga litoralis]MBG1233018.1 DUF697 domain-containing protein [Aestuariivirga litoralis]